MQSPPDPIAYSIADAAKVSGLGKSSLYYLLSDGTLEARKAGSKTLIIAQSLKRYIEGLPPATLNTKRPAPRRAA